MSGITHIAGLRIETGPLIRQRCAWCGAVLVDADLTRVEFATDDPNKTIATWPPGNLVHVDGPASTTTTSDRLPDDSCAALDPSVTR